MKNDCYGSGTEFCGAQLVQVMNDNNSKYGVAAHPDAAIMAWPKSNVV
jgi:hypothetical protein